MELKHTYDELLAEVEKLKRKVELYKKKYEREHRIAQKLDVYSSLAPVAIIDWDLELKVEYWNKSAEEIFEFTVDEALGKYVWEFVLNEEREEAREEWKELLKNQTSGSFTTTNYTKSGKQIICNWYNATIHHDNKLVGITSVVLDITGQKQTERELLESNDRFKTLSMVSFEAIFLTENGYGVDANEVGCEMFGYSHDEILEMFATDVFAEESKELVKRNLFSGYLEAYEAIAIKKNGTKFPVEVQGKNYIYNGRNIRVTAVRDISERKKAEQELKKNELKFKTIFENAGYGIVVGNIDNKIVDVNNSFCKISGYSKEEIAGNGFEFLFTKESLEKKPFRCDLFEKKEPVVFEREILSKTGEKVPVEMNSKQVDEKFFISIFTDLKERKKSEKALKRFNQQLKIAKEQAEEGNNLKTAFLQNMSHEIRTPMNGIIGFSEMLNHPDISEERQKFYTDIIVKSSGHLLDIVNNILDISKVETGLIELIEKNTNINKLLLELFAFYQPQAWKKNVNMHINLPLEDNKSTIIVDEIKLRQILSNLISNALKFTHRGYIKMGYKLKNENLEFYVEDTGIGIEGSLHDKIFERFRQAELTTTRKYGGTGLGLSISRAYVKLLKGELWLKSTKNKGTTFYFTLPYAKRVAVKGKQVESNRKNFRNMKISGAGKILIAEDEEFNYMYLRELVHGLKIELLHARNGLEAIEMVKANKNIMLVLMDIKMPNLNGLAATKEIKKIRPNLPVIAQTAYAMAGDREKAIKAGCDNYISKPISRTDLLNMVRIYV